MDKWKLAGTGVLLTLSALAVAIAYHHPITARVAIAGPFATDRIADEATVTLADGRPLVLHGGTLSLGDKTFPLTTSRHFASLTTMPTGQVLIWGGVDGDGHLVETGEWFEPTTGALVTTGRLGLPVRAAHTLTVLSDGSLAMTGGWGPGNVPSHEVAIWRPLDRHLDLKPDGDTHARLGGSATLLADGTLKIAGGIDDIGRPAHDAWQYGAPDARRTATPGIAASYPLKDAAGASPIGPLALRFDEPVDVAQLNGTVSLLGPNGVVKTRVVGAENGRLAFIQLPDELYPSARYTIFVQGLHTAAGKAVPYEAIGFTTRAARNGVVLAGEGKRPGAGAAAATEPAVYVMAGEGTVKPCKPGDAFHLCRDKGEVKDGAFYPGQDNVATASGGHWRLYKDRQSLPDTRQLEANLPKGSTALIGQVRRIDETPVANVAISVDGQTVQTDARGVFVLQNLPSGRRELLVDGRPAGKPGTEYGRFVVGADVAATTINHMPFVMYLPRVLERDKIPLPSPTTRETVLTHPDMPGLELRIPAGAVFKDRDGKVLNEIAIVPTPVDHAPFPLPDNFPMYFTIQPGDAVVQGMTPDAAKGIQVVYPNYGKQKPADKGDFWVYSAEKGWEMYGAGHVSNDASQLVADNDTRLVWALGAGASTNPPQKDNGKKPKNACVGDPVDLQTGQFFAQQTDLRLDDTIPVSIDRAFSGVSDTTSPFGLGTSSSLAMTISGEDFERPKLVLPCGEPIYFDLTSGQPNWPLVGTVWKHQSTTSDLYGATLQFLNDSTPAGAHWVMTTKHGDEYWFDRHAPNKIYQVRDRFGNAVQYLYNGGLLSSVISPHGRSISVSYNSQNLISSVTDDTGRSVRYTYHQQSDGSGSSVGWLLDQATFPDGTSESYTYHKHQSQGATIETLQVESIHDRRGNKSIENRYDDVTGRVIGQTFADGTSMSFQYHIENGTLLDAVVEDQVGIQKKVAFDATTGYPSTVTRALGSAGENTVHITRAPSGLVTSVVDQTGRVTTVERDAAGNVTSVTRMSGTSEAATYSFGYSTDLSLLTSVTDPLGNKSTADYKDGCVSRTTDALGNIAEYACDPEGHVISETDASGRSTHRKFEGGNLVQQIDSAGNVTSFVANALGQMVARAGPDGSPTLFRYDVNDRLVKSIDPSRGATTITYDGIGNITEVVTPSGAHTLFVYDVMNRPIRRVDPSGAAESWVYRKDGYLASHIDRRGNETLYQFDDRKQLSFVAYSDGSTLTRSYDQGGRLISLKDSIGGDLAWEYDGMDRIIKASANGTTIAYAFDKADRRTTMQMDGDEPLVYAYDNDGRLTSMTQGLTDVAISYDRSGRREQVVLPGGVTMKYAFDAAGRVQGLRYTDSIGRSLQDIDVLRDSAGRTTSHTSNPQEALMERTDDAQAVVDTADRLVSKGESAFHYDSNGNLTDDGMREYVWDARNQLIAVNEAGREVAHYSYDGLGRRQKAELNGNTYTYVYDGSEVLSRSSKDSVSTFINGPLADERFVERSSSGVRTFFTDLRGSTVGLLDATGAFTARYQYSPYGVTAGDIGNANPFLFTGRERDLEDLYFFRARYYQPSLGRFLSEDPIGFDGSRGSLYEYASGNPIDYVDPFGLAVGDRYSTPVAAGMSAVAEFNHRSICEDREYTGWVYRNWDGTYSYSEPTVGNGSHSEAAYPPLWHDPVAGYHTHAGWHPNAPGYEFSDTDINTSNDNHMPEYLGTPAGDIKRYTPSSNQWLGDVDTLLKGGVR